MGFISGMKAVAAGKKIKAGGTAKLSISQMTEILINLPDANRNLTKEEFNNILSVFLGLKKVKGKIEMDMDKFIETAIWIIKKFDAYAPYEKYSGGSEIEFAILMDEIRDD